MDPHSKPPLARRELAETTWHGRTVRDPYAWMRNRSDAAVLRHLEAENAFTAAVMADAELLSDQLYEEFRKRIPDEDVTVPVLRGRYLYGERLVEGAQYPRFWRRAISVSMGDSATNPPGLEDPPGLEAPSDADEEVLLDLDAMAADGYLALGAFRVSPAEDLFAYSIDRNGSELYELRIRDLKSGEDLPDRIPGTARGGEWASDGQSFFYVTRDHAHRPYRVYRHRLGTSAAEDELVFEEPDERFFLSLGKTRSQRFLVLTLGTHTTSEIHVIDAASPESPPRCIARRQGGVEWQLDHWHDSTHPAGFFFARTNLDVPLGRLVRASVPAVLEGSPDWQEVVPTRAEIVLSAVDAFAGYLVLSIRREGLSGLEVLPLDGGEVSQQAGHEIAFDEPLYTVGESHNEVFESSWLRFTYQSPLVPRSVYDYHLRERRRVLRKRAEVDGYEPENYTCRRLLVPSADGTEIPVSLVERQDRQAGGPMLLYAYGSYGTPLEPRFSIARLSLLDRGFAVGLVHARGGGEMGRPWYEAAKLGDKPRTFDDVIAAAEAAIERGLTTRRGLALRGGSAGGLMVGAVLNRRGDLFHTALAEVPFVDVLNTMLDPSIPLTVIEFEEWGNPAEDADAFDAIASYSPYENVRRGPYPHLLVTAGINDTRVQYWEPAKWVARLRERRSNDNLLLLKVEMGSGHVGASGRYNSLREEAVKTAFLLHSLEIEHRPAE